MNFLRSLLFFLCALPLYAADAPAKPQHHTVKLKGEKLKLSAVLREIGEQTGITVQPAEDVGDPEIDVNLVGVPFWQAIDTVAEKVGAKPYFYGRDSKIRLQKASKPGNALVHYDGLFRVSIRRITALHDFDTGGRDLTAFLEVVWEPQLMPIYFDTRPLHLKVEDSKGKSLSVKAQGSQLVPADSRLSMQVDVPLPVVPRGDDKLALLEGEFTVRAPSKMLSFALGNLDALARGKFPAVNREEGTTCTITSIKLDRTRWTVDVDVLLPEGGPGFESFQTWTANNELYLVNTKARVRLSPTSSDLIDSTSRKARLSYTFDGKGVAPGKPEDFTMIYRAPASIVELPIRFQFKNVPLP